MTIRSQATDTKPKRYRGGEGRLALFKNAFYSASDVARLLRVSVATARAYMTRREMPLKYANVTERLRRVYGGWLAQFLGIDEPPTTKSEMPGLYLNAFYSTQDLAAMLGCNSRTVLNLVNDPASGLSGSRAIGGRVRVYGAAVADFLRVPRDMVPTLDAGPEN